MRVEKETVKRREQESQALHAREVNNADGTVNIRVGTLTKNVYTLEAFEGRKRGKGRTAAFRKAGEQGEQSEWSKEKMKVE